MKTLPILQSGYIALNELNLIKGVDEGKIQELSNTLTGQSYKSKFNPYFYNSEVESLFTRYITEPKILSNFEYREDLLKTTKQVFDNNFIKFMELQLNSPYLSVMHSKFLVDTANYISTGYRNIDILSWRSLVRIKDDINCGKHALASLVSNNDMRETLTLDLANVVALWTKRRHGFPDLIYTLKIIFGKTMDTVLV